MTRPTIRLLVACVLTLCACEAAVFETEHGGIEEGNEALVQGTPGEALVAYEEAAQSVPESAGLNYDRGLALSELGRHDDATQMLLRALDARDAELRAKVLSALGLAYSRWGLHVERTGEAVTDDAAVDGPATPEAPDASEAALPKWERAVAHLEDALALMPADADVLRNLEIALLRVDPPCVARADEAPIAQRPNPPPVAPRQGVRHGHDPSVLLDHEGAATSHDLGQA